MASRRRPLLEQLLAALPFDKIAKRYFFESDMLFRLNIMRCVVMDIPMDAHYADEVSNLRIRSILGEFMFKHLRNFGKRIFYNYFLRDMSLASLELVAGLGFLVDGNPFVGTQNFTWSATQPHTIATITPPVTRPTTAEAEAARALKPIDERALPFGKDGAVPRMPGALFTILGVELRQDVFHLAFDRLFAQTDRLGDLLVRVALRDEAQNTDLCRREALVSDLRGQIERYLGGQHLAASVHGTYGVKQFLVQGALEQVAASAGLQGALKCGTQCGSCVPELRRLVRATPQAAETAT